MKPFILTTLVLCILTTSLLVPSGTAHAQTRTSFAPQQTTIAADSGSNYFFYAGAWGWGFCLSHDTTQGLADGSGTPRAIAWMYITHAVGFWSGLVAFSVVEGIVWYLQWRVDQGRGVCIAFAWGSPAFPWAWSQ